LRLRLLCLFTFCLFSISCSSKPETKLVVFLVADQMRPDHLSRFKNLYKGGFKWLIENGFSFQKAFHQHGYTATGPGHFAIASGKHPGPAGVLGNSYYDRELDKVVNCVEDVKAKTVGGDGKARSFVRYNNKMIGDILKEKSPKSKVISIAGKDRSAIMMAGKNPDLVLYYNNIDKFITSDYYSDTLPQYINEFNDELNFETYRDSLWTKILPDSMYLKYARLDNFKGEVDSYHMDHDLVTNTKIKTDNYNPVFPISFDQDKKPGAEILGTPWFDDKLVDLSKLILDKGALGADKIPDLLFIGFSAMDYIIHNFGPFSQETMDYLIRLDLQLDELISHIENTIGLEHVEFVLTSDHGGLPLPEFLPQLNLTGGRINRDNLQEAYDWIDDEISEFYDENLFYRHGTNFYFYHDKLKKKNILSSDLENIIKKYLKMIDGVKTVLSKTEIVNSKETDVVSLRLKNMVHIDQSADIFVILEPGYLYKTPYGTSHGSPYDYDAHVPLLFIKKGRTKTEFSVRTETVDIVPTILNLLDVKTDYPLDGKILPIQ
jgi:predicted AlkP superfamily pyrophosphatase or phosphodiesterase